MMLFMLENLHMRVEIIDIMVLMYGGQSQHLGLC